mmetsp:Transcript_2016/g.3038  ORF Transcript_2016/g.3038 Transcript_2016/m.3038 type:complete len:95 (+) Transcript_2016:106-390(+)
MVVGGIGVLCFRVVALIAYVSAQDVQSNTSETPLRNYKGHLSTFSAVNAMGVEEGSTAKNIGYIGFGAWIMMVMSLVMYQAFGNLWQSPRKKET